MNPINVALSNAADQAALEAIATSLVHQCPSLQEVAHAVAADLLDKYAIKDLDPDQVYYHRFKTAQSSGKTFTGWEHTFERPYESQTLTQLVIHRFRVTDFDNADLLDLYGGFYTAGPDHQQFNETNEVRLHGNDVLKDFWNIDFSGLYRDKLQAFWKMYAVDFRTLAKCNFLAKALDARTKNQLSAADFKWLINAVAADVTVPVSLQSLRHESTRTDEAQIAAFDIDGHTSAQLMRIIDRNGRQILYIPAGDRPFMTFETAAELHWWVLEQLNDDASRLAFLAHFPLAARQKLAENLTDLMNRMVATWGHSDHHLINQNNQIVHGDAFTWLRDSTRSAMFDEADLSLTSNGDLRKKLWIGYLSAGLKVFGPLAAVGWPVALPVIGASLVSMGLNIDQAVNGRTAADRKNGVIGAILGGINALFNVPFLKSAESLADVGPALDAAEASEMADLLDNSKPPESGVASTKEASPPTPETAAPVTLEIETPLSGTDHPPEIPQLYQSNELLEGQQPIADSGQYQGIYRLESDPPYAISLNDNSYYVHYFADSKGGGYWAIVDPERPNQFIHSLPVRLNAAGEWELMPRLGLKGAGQCMGKECVVELELQPAQGAAGGASQVQEPDLVLIDPVVAPNPSTSTNARLRTIETAYDVEPAFRPSVRKWAMQVRETHVRWDILSGAVTPPDLYAIHCVRKLRALADAAARFYRNMSWVNLPPRPVLPEVTPSTTFADLIASVFKTDSGMVISHTPGRITSMRLMIENMPALARHGVRTIYVRRLLNDFAQKGLNDFFQGGEMSETLHDYLSQLSTDPAGRFDELHLVEAAKKNGIRIQATDCAATYRAPTTALRIDEQMMTNHLTNDIMSTDAAVNHPGKWVVLTNVESVNTFRGLAGISELKGAIGIRIEEVNPGTGSSVALDPGIEISRGPIRAGTIAQGDADTFHADLRVQIEAPLVIRDELQTALLLRRRGMYLFEKSEGIYTLVHRSNSDMIVRTPVQVHADGSLSIDRPSWAIHQRHYPNLEQLSLALDHLGLILQSRLPL